MNRRPGNGLGLRKAPSCRPRLHRSFVCSSVVSATPLIPKFPEPVDTRTYSPMVRALLMLLATSLQVPKPAKLCSRASNIQATQAQLAKSQRSRKSYCVVFAGRPNGWRLRVSLGCAWAGTQQVPTPGTPLPSPSLKDLFGFPEFSPQAFKLTRLDKFPVWAPRNWRWRGGTRVVPYLSEFDTAAQPQVGQL